MEMSEWSDDAFAGYVAAPWTPPPEAESFDLLIADARAEAAKAMRKFPQPNHVISKVAEEAGEVVKAAIHCAEGREDPANVRVEMKQLIAMLYRLWVEGDQVHGLSPMSPPPSPRYRETAMSDQIKAIVAYHKWCMSILTATTADPNARAQIENHRAWADAIEALQSKAAALESENNRLTAERDQFARMWEENQDLLAQSKEIGFQFDEIKRLTAERDEAEKALAAYDAAPGGPVCDWNVMQLGQIGWHVRQTKDGWHVGRLFGADSLATEPEWTEKDATPSAAPAWTPPEDRPEGFNCLGWLDTEWLHVVWLGNVWRWVSDSAEIVAPTAFAPLPQEPRHE